MVEFASRRGLVIVDVSMLCLMLRCGLVVSWLSRLPLPWLALCTRSVIVMVRLPTVLRVDLCFILVWMVVTSIPAAARNGRQCRSLVLTMVGNVLNLVTMARNALNRLLRVQKVLGRVMWCIIEYDMLFLPYRLLVSLFITE